MYCPRCFNNVYTKSGSAKCKPRSKCKSCNYRLGFAYRNVIQTGIENPNDKLYGLGVFDNASTNKWAPTLPFNLKIGFRF